MDIDGLGAAIVDSLIEKGLLKTPADIYSLSLENVKSLWQSGSTAANKLLNAIENSKQQDLSRLIFALGIRQVGAKTGKVLAGPDLVSRGFVYVRDNEDLMADDTVVVRNSLGKCKLNGFRDWATIKGRIRDELGDFIASRTHRQPVILPIIPEV